MRKGRGYAPQDSKGTPQPSGGAPIAQSIGGVVRDSMESATVLRGFVKKSRTAHSSTMNAALGDRRFMWSKRKEDEVPQRPERPAAAPQSSAHVVEAPKRESLSMSSPSRSFDSETPVRSGSAALGKNVTVKGQIFAREDLTIDGEVEGTVECHDHRLTIGPNARVQAGLKAREIIIQGSIQGNVDAADKIDIKKEAKLVGDIKTSRIVIEDGAYFKGSIDISKPAAKAPAATPPVQQPQPVTPAATPESGNKSAVTTSGKL
jgi:cytoskeletal protein CcmA (bactofilin family)